ncbi:probable capsid portal protein [Salmonella enterica subsp. enterica]|uniref:Probable capsid portal protein n=1 Tax=Salmonella enterica I TaxID=59201 RepID=A0A3S4J0Q3_SALET|nr:probable capsid portal protein [Salmonella enterica subsp. enterica]
MMAAHRVPPQMMGIMPSNVGGFGDVEKSQPRLLFATS